MSYKDTLPRDWRVNQREQITGWPKVSWSTTLKNSHYMHRLAHCGQAPVPLTVSRSNLKFDKNLECSRLKFEQPITPKFCTRHESYTVVTCAKFLCDWKSTFQTRALEILVEIWNLIEISLVGRAPGDAYKLGHHCFRYWVVVCSATNLYLNQYCILINKLQRKWFFFWKTSWNFCLQNTSYLFRPCALMILWQWVTCRIYNGFTTRLCCWM